MFKFTESLLIVLLATMKTCKKTLFQQETSELLAQKARNKLLREAKKIERDIEKKMKEERQLRRGEQALKIAASEAWSTETPYQARILRTRPVTIPLDRRQ